MIAKEAFVAVRRLEFRSNSLTLLLQPLVTQSRLHGELKEAKQISSQEGCLSML